MRDRCHRWLNNLLVAACCAAVAVAVAADGKPGADGPPPRAYRLDDVTVRLQRQPGHGQPTRELVLAGKGQSTLQRGEKTLAFDHAAKDLVDVLNGLYRIRFFDLPARVRPTVSVFLKDDGTVGTQVLKMADAGATTVCFTLPSYQKCVQYEGAGPRELDDFVQRLLADADQRAQAAAPPK